MGAQLFLPRLRQDQWRIVSHPAKTKAVAMGRRWGKTIMAGATALSAASQGAKVAWIVPHYKNGRPLWRWAEAATAPLKKRKLVETNRTERMIDFLTSGGFLGIYSADNDSSIRGEWFNLAILEEAAQIAEETWTEVVQPTLADADGDAILISTPKGKNWFWREWQRGSVAMDAEVAAFTAPSADNPNPRIQRASLLAKERVSDNVYRQEWLAEFVDDAQDIFSREWFSERRFDAADQRHVNACVGRWISWDTAFMDTDSAAYTACVVGELTPDYRLFIREVWRDKLTFPNLMAQIERKAVEHNADGKLQAVIIESKASGISAYQTITETSDAWLAALVRPFAPQGSKEQRAELAAVWCKQGCVWLPEPAQSAPWLFAFEEEFFAFPDSPFKDQVDASGQLILYLSHYLNQGREARARAAAVMQEGSPNGLVA